MYSVLVPVGHCIHAWHYPYHDASMTPLQHGAHTFLSTGDNLPGTLDDNTGGVREGIAAILDCGRWANVMRHMGATGGGVGGTGGGVGERARENCAVRFIVGTAPS